MIEGPPFYDPDEWEPDLQFSKPLLMPMYEDGRATHFYMDLQGNIYSYEHGEWEKVLSREEATPHHDS